MSIAREGSDERAASTNAPQAAMVLGASLPRRRARHCNPAMTYRVKNDHSVCARSTQDLMGTMESTSLDVIFATG